MHTIQTTKIQNLHELFCKVTLSKVLQGADLEEYYLESFQQQTLMDK